MPEIKSNLFIDNEWQAAEGEATFSSINPADESEICQVAEASANDIDNAVTSSARAMQDTWHAVSAEDRGRLLMKLAETIERRAEEIAHLETIDMGKPLRESHTNIKRAIRTLEYYAGAADKIHGDSFDVGSRGFNMTTFVPLGVTAHITPWNYPFANAMRSLPPAIAAGNTAVIKPATQTSLTTLLLGELCAEAGFPSGVVNVVSGSGSVAGQALARHPLVKGITFTGSVTTGRLIANYAAEHFRPTVLELGGKNPQVVFADADFDHALAQTVRGAFTNCGQVCTSVSRVVVEHSIYQDYVEGLKERLERLTIGPGLDSHDLGPLVSAEHYKEVEGFAKIASEDGARLVTGGKRADGFDKGYFFAPTLFDEVEAGMRIAQQEVFGPILVVIPFDTEAEALEIANGTEFGLTSGVFTKDIDRALRFAKHIEAGMVWINEWFQSPVQVPHGGVKNSGLGREQGMVALHNYLETKNIAFKIR